MKRKKNNKYKGKKYKRPLDNYIEKYTAVDDGNIINDAYNSIMRYAMGSVPGGIGYYSSEEEKAAQQQTVGLNPTISNTLNTIAGTFVSGQEGAWDNKGTQDPDSTFAASQRKKIQGERAAQGKSELNKKNKEAKRVAKNIGKTNKGPQVTEETMEKIEGTFEQAPEMNQSNIIDISTLPDMFGISSTEDVENFQRFAFGTTGDEDDNLDPEKIQQLLDFAKTLQAQQLNPKESGAETMLVNKGSMGAQPTGSADMPSTNVGDFSGLMGGGSGSGGGGGMMGGMLGQMGVQMVTQETAKQKGEFMRKLREGSDRYLNWPDFKGASQVVKYGGKIYKDGGTVEKGKPAKESKQARYIKKYVPVIKSAAEKLGVNVDVGAVATHIALETGYVFGNGLATNNHNYGGIKARGKQPFTVEETREYFKDEAEAKKWEAKRKENNLLGPTGKVDKKTGKLEYKVETPFRKFATEEEGMMAQIKLITIPRYAKRGTTESLGDPGKYFTAVAEGGYATSPTYNQKLVDLYNSTTLPLLEQYFPGMGIQIQGASNTQNNTQDNTQSNTQGSTQQQPVQERQEQIEESELLSPEELQEYSGSVNAPKTYSKKKTSKKGDSPIKTTYHKPSQMPNMNQKRGLNWHKFYAGGGKIKGNPPKNTADNSIDFLGQQSFADMYGIPELNLPISPKKNDPNLQFNTGMSYPGNIFVSGKGKVGDGSISGSLEQNIYNETFSPNWAVRGQYPLNKNINITGGFTGDFKRGVGGANIGLTGKFNTGGNIEKETIVEVEGGEAYETPNGEVGEFVGPDHSDDPTKESGIKFQVGDENSNMIDFAKNLSESNLVNKGSQGIIPEGTEIYSKQISKNGKTMAEKKLKTAKYIKSLEKKIEENPTDLLLLQTYAIAKEKEELENGAMQRVQAEVNAVENLKGLGTYLAKYGGKVGCKNMENGGKVHKYQNGTWPNIWNNFGQNNQTMGDWIYAAQKNQEAEDLLNSMAEANIKDKTLGAYSPLDILGGQVFDVASEDELSRKKYDPITMQPVDVQSISTNYDPTTVKLIDEPLSNNKFSEDTTSLLDEIAAEEVASTTQGQEPYEFTLGDKLGLMGTGIAGLGPMATTFMSRASDKPNQNFYEQFGQDAINTLEGTKGFLGQQFRMQEAKIGEFARNARRRFNSTARSVNQQRALGQMSNMQANDMLNKAYQQYAAGMIGVDNQLAQLKFQQGLYEAKGATEAADKDAADKDAFYTALNQDVANMGAAMQAGGKGLNAKEYDRDINKLMPMLSPYGIGIRKDAKGNWEYYQMATGTSTTTKEVQRIIKQFEEEETAKEEKTTEEDATTSELGNETKDTKITGGIQRVDKKSTTQKKDEEIKKRRKKERKYKN